MTTTAIPTQRTTRGTIPTLAEMTQDHIADLERQIAALRDQLADAEHRATHDPLTGLLNRAGLEELWRGSYASWSLAVLDLDGFKAINDQYGHAVGDEVLKAVAHRIDQLFVVPTKVGARLGGDEFAVAIPADDFAHALGRMLDAPVLLGEGLAVYPTAAIGVAPAGLDLSGALHRADMAMYEAKFRAKQRRTNGEAAASEVFVYDPAVLGQPYRQDRPNRRLRDRSPHWTANKADLWQVQVQACGHLPGDQCGCPGPADLTGTPVIQIGAKA